MKKTDDTHFFFPNLCRFDALVALIIAAELVAFILAFARMGTNNSFSSALLHSTMALQSVCLTSAVCLCSLRPYYAQLKLWLAITLMMINVIVITALFSLVFSLLIVEYDIIEEIPRGTYVLRNVCIGTMIGLVLIRYFYAREKWRNDLRLQSAAELEALQAKIRPHFFFNSMNTIASLTRTDPREAERAVENLATLFRASLSEMRSMVPIKEEISITQSYVDIEQKRLGDRLSVKWELADGFPLQAEMPLLSLQPLLENAIYHGVQPLPEGGVVTVHASFTNSVIEIRVTNPLTLVQRPYQQHKGNNMAMNNIKQRLKLAFGDAAKLAVEKDTNSYTAILSFPYGREV